MPESDPGREAAVIYLDHYRDAALLRRLLGSEAPGHAAKTLGKCLSVGDDDGAARWRAISAAIDRLGRGRYAWFL